MPKQPRTHAPGIYENAVYNGQTYLSWLTDLEFTGCNDAAVIEVVHVATGYNPHRWSTGRDD